MRVLVTGANGFVGAAVTRQLRSRGHQVRRAVRGGDSDPDAVAVGDLAREPDWRTAVEGMQAVVHLAGRSHVVSAAGDRETRLHHLVNTEATHSLLEECALEGVRKVVFASTVKVHGETSGAGVLSESAPCSPLDSYARSKLEAEGAVRSICEGTQTEYSILRLPLVYGRGVKGNMLRLLRAVAAGWPLPLASVRATRSLIGLPALCRIIEQCLECEAVANRCFLVADGSDVTLPEVIRALAVGLGRPARLLPCPAIILEKALRATGRKADAQRLLRPLRVDPSRLYQALGGQPPGGTEKGLIEMAVAFGGKPWGSR